MSLIGPAFQLTLTLNDRHGKMRTGVRDEHHWS